MNGMNAKNVLLRFIPDVRNQINERNKFVAEYTNIFTDARNENEVKFDFSETNAEYLGFTLLWIHKKLKNTIQECAGSANTGYRVHSSDKQSKIERGAILMIIFIKVRNLLSFMFWLIFVLFVFLIISFGSDIITQLISV